jgi:2'-5' RNA ligase
VYSLNVPVPSAVGRLATSLGGRLADARVRPRGEHTLVCKRLGGGNYHRIEARARDALDGAPAVEARVDAVGIFDEPPTGPAPVVYLAVESPGLQDLHRRLCAVFDPVDGLEGDDYVPHVTVARGGSRPLAERLLDADFDPIEWTISDLRLYDAERGETVSRVSLPR